MVLEFLRQYLWLWVIVGAVLASALIILIFILVIKCIFRREKLHRRSDISNRNSKYEDGHISSSTHATKFLHTATQSYENLSEAPNWSVQHQEKDYRQDSSSADQDPHDYELVGPDGLQDRLSEYSLPDYVSVDYASTGDYDDIEGDDEVHSEEDYDDVE